MRTMWRFDRRRRTFLRNAGAAAATAALGPLIISERTIAALASEASGQRGHFMSARAQTRTLYMNSWGGSFTAAQDVAYFKPFTALTGIQIRTVTPVSYGKIKAQVQTGRYEFDMTSINSMQWLRASREGLAEPIDWTIVDKSALPPRRRGRQRARHRLEHPGHQPLLSSRQIPRRRSQVVGRFLGRREISRTPAAYASTIRRAR